MADAEGVEMVTEEDVIGAEEVAVEMEGRVEVATVEKEAGGVEPDAETEGLGVKTGGLDTETEGLDAETEGAGLRCLVDRMRGVDCKRRLLWYRNEQSVSGQPEWHNQTPHS